jgi:hypothetical protein
MTKDNINFRHRSKCIDHLDVLVSSLRLKRSKDRCAYTTNMNDHGPGINWTTYAQLIWITHLRCTVTKTGAHLNQMHRFYLLALLVGNVACIVCHSDTVWSVSKKITIQLNNPVLLILIFIFIHFCYIVTLGYVISYIITNHFTLHYQHLTIKSTTFSRVYNYYLPLIPIMWLQYSIYMSIFY